jgi:hypothetical protein
MRARLRRAVSLLSIALLASCATVRETGRGPIDGDRGAVRVAVFADDDAHAAGALLAESVAGVLEQRQGREWRPLFRSLDASWSVAGLEPGRYRVRFDATLDERGRPEALERPVVRAVDVRAGEVVDLELVLDHVSPAMVAAGAAAVVVAAILLHEWLDDLDLPRPPPPPSWAIDAAFWVALDLSSRPDVWVPRERVPQVTSHFPRAGEIVPPGFVQVIFVLSEPIVPSLLIEDPIAVETEDGGWIPGTVRWDADRWWLVWEPDEELPPATRFRATLRAAELAESTGLLIAGATGFEFETEP